MPGSAAAAFRKAREEAGSLEAEIPYFGWLDDGRTCLTRRAELVTMGRLTPCPTAGLGHAQISAVVERWVRALGQLDERTRLSLFVLRRPLPPAGSGRGGHRRRVGAGARGAPAKEALPARNLRRVDTGPAPQARALGQRRAGLARTRPGPAAAGPPDGLDPQQRRGRLRAAAAGRRRLLPAGRGPDSDPDPRARRGHPHPERAGQPSRHRRARRAGLGAALAPGPVRDRGGAPAAADRRRGRAGLLPGGAALGGGGRPAARAAAAAGHDDRVVGVPQAAHGQGAVADRHRPEILLRQALRHDGPRAGHGGDDLGHARRGGRHGSGAAGPGAGRARGRRHALRGTRAGPDLARPARGDRAPRCRGAAHLRVLRRQGHSRELRAAGSLLRAAARGGAGEPAAPPARLRRRRGGAGPAVRADTGLAAQRPPGRGVPVRARDPRGHALPLRPVRRAAGATSGTP